MPAKEMNKMVRYVTIFKFFKVGCLMLLLSLPSCALITSYRRFSLEREPNFTFQEKTSYYDGKSNALVFYEDGSFLLMSLPME